MKKLYSTEYKGNITIEAIINKEKDIIDTNNEYSILKEYFEITNDNKKNKKICKNLSKYLIKEYIL